MQENESRFKSSAAAAGPLSLTLPPQILVPDKFSAGLSSEAGLSIDSGLVLTQKYQRFPDTGLTHTERLRLKCSSVRTHLSVCQHRSHWLCVSPVWENHTTMSDTELKEKICQII